MPDINDAYYMQLTGKLKNCAVEEFSAVVSQHKSNMLAAKFREPSEKVFAENLSWIAQEVIMQPYGRNYKEPSDITEADLKKLEILKAEHGFDYMKDLRIGFTVDRDGARLEYSEPFLVYLASGKGDFTDYQTRLIEALVESLESRKWDLGISYSMRSGRGNNHNDNKNIFHVLMEGELTPNKKKIADIVAPELAEKSYRIYATTESWDSSRGGKVYQPWDAYRNALHSAVSSGRLENVEYALSKGAKQSTKYNGYGSTAFADAVARNDEPAYHAIALRLFENALTLENGAEILREYSRWKESGRRPIETLARFGDLPFTIAMAQANAGDPETAVNTFTHTSPVTLGGYHSVGGGEVVTHPAIQSTRTKTEYQVYETGKTEDPFPYIHQAVFNLDPKEGSYAAHHNVFGQAVKYLVKNGALQESQIPENSLTDPRSLNFIFSMRAAAEAEKARNPSFLAKTAVFTEGFTEEVKKAASLTNNFRVIYDPLHPHETSAKAYDDEALSSGQAIPVKGPLRLKKAKRGVAR
jgi:hypothetical protein